MALALSLLPILALAGAGCTEKACIDWPAGRGACPSKEEALKTFGGQSCVSEITNVVTEGELDDNACCYEVETRGSSERSCGVVGAGPTGGKPPPPQTCGGCAALLFASATEACPGSEVLFNDLIVCLCSAEGACAAACDDGTCANPFDSGVCETCMGDTANGCGNQFNSCMNDP